MAPMLVLEPHELRSTPEGPIGYTETYDAKKSPKAILLRNPSRPKTIEVQVPVPHPLELLTTDLELKKKGYVAHPHQFVSHTGGRFNNLYAHFGENIFIGSPEKGFYGAACSLVVYEGQEIDSERARALIERK